MRTLLILLLLMSPAYAKYKVVHHSTKVEELEARIKLLELKLNTMHNFVQERCVTPTVPKPIVKEQTVQSLLPQRKDKGDIRVSDLLSPKWGNNQQWGRTWNAK